MRWRLVAAFVGLVAIVLLVQDLPLGAHLERVERDRLETGLERDAFVLAARSEDVLEGTVDDDGRLADQAAAYAERTGATVVITDAAGVAVATGGAGEATGEPYVNRPEIEAAVEGRFASGERLSRTLGEPLVYVAVPVLSQDDVLGAVRLTYPASVIDDRVADRVRGLVVAAAISITAAAVVAVLLAMAVTRPLRRLRSVTDRLAGGDLDTRADVTSGPPEVRALANSFNQMSDRLGTLVVAQEGFASDASHQLRTPLTALRLRLEQARDLLDVDPDAARTRLDAATVETDRLARLTDGLLALARPETAATRPGSVDIASTVRDRGAAWEALADERNVALVVDTPDHAWALAVDGTVEQIVDGYLDNALDAAPGGSTVRLAVGREGGSVALHVIDEGPGLDEESRRRAFDRFWRGPGSEGGSGLGLAIIRRLADASGAVVELRRGPSGGIDAVALLRPAPQAATAGTSGSDDAGGDRVSTGPAPSVRPGR